MKYNQHKHKLQKQKVSYQQARLNNIYINMIKSVATVEIFK